MPRNISFALTTRQFLNGTKTVTRRLGWKFLKPGDHLMAVEKAMGLRRGEQIKRFGLLEVISVRRERLWDITQDDVLREGFPHFNVPGFIDMFCEHMGCKSHTFVTRIEFRKLGDQKCKTSSAPRSRGRKSITRASSSSAA